MAKRAAVNVEIIDITKDGDNTIYTARAGLLNITCTFIGEISDKAAAEFSRVFHAAMDRIEAEEQAAECEVVERDDILDEFCPLLNKYEHKMINRQHGK